MKVHLAPYDGDVVLIEARDGHTIKASLLTLTSYEALRILAHDYQFETLLDIGSAKGQHSEIFKALGKKVSTVDASFDADIVGDYVTTKLPHQYDAIWCSHVLEHQRNVGSFLDKVYDDLRDGGVLAITVPPVTTHWISSGHCNWFNGGMLLYHLVMAGFDCREARVLTYRYNVSVIVRKVPTGLQRVAWATELDELQQFLPPRMIRDSGMSGAIHHYGAMHALPANPHAASAMGYAAGEIRYLIDNGHLDRARVVLSESLQFNASDPTLAALKAELDALPVQ